MWFKRLFSKSLEELEKAGLNPEQAAETDDWEM